MWPISRDELDVFIADGKRRLERGEDFTWLEFFPWWRMENPPQQELAEIMDWIRRGRVGFDEKASLQVTHVGLDRIHSYALNLLCYCKDEPRWTDLLDVWNIAHPTDAEIAEMKEIIEQGIADIEAGRGIPVDEFMAELRRKHGLNRA